MVYSRSARRGRTRRALIAVSVVAVCAVGTPWYALGAGAAPASVHGDTDEPNNCVVALTPALQPPGAIPLETELAATGSPAPHTSAAVTLSGTTFTVTYPSLFGGFVADGTVIPVTGSLVFAASNTTEVTHTYSLSTSMTFQTGQHLVATFALPNTTWHPLLGNVAVAFTKPSFSTALSLTLTGIGVVVATFTCTTPAPAAVVTLNGTPSPTTTTSTTTTSTTTTTTPGPPVTACSGIHGTIDSVLTNNGVGGSGLLYTRKSPQQLKASASGQTCSGGIVGAARTRMTVTTQTPVNCQTLPASPAHAAVPLGGAGTLTWTPAGMGTSNFNVQWAWTSKTTIHFSGSVSAAGSGDNTFARKHVSGNLTTRQSLAPVASGGNCTATLPLTHFDITKISYRLS